jgi:hypothetical protein
MKKLRLAVVAVAFSAIMVLGVSSIPSSSASTIKRVNPDLYYWSPTVSVYSHWGGAGSGWGYTAGTSGSSRAMSVSQWTTGGGIGASTLSMMYEFRTQSYYCSQSATFTLYFYWQTTWNAGWVTDTHLGSATAKVAIYIGGDVYDATSGSASWLSRGQHNLKVIDEKIPGWQSWFWHDQQWSKTEYGYSVHYSVALKAGHTYVFYSPVYTTTYASGTGLAVSFSHLSFVGTFVGVDVIGP